MDDIQAMHLGTDANLIDGDGIFHSLSEQYEIRALNIIMCCSDRAGDRLVLVPRRIGCIFSGESRVDCLSMHAHTHECRRRLSCHNKSIRVIVTRHF